MTPTPPRIQLESAWRKFLANLRFNQTTRVGQARKARHVLRRKMARR